MVEDAPSLCTEARAVIDAEQELLGRVRASLEEARRRAQGRPGGGGGSGEALRSLRDQAARASADDLPALLHEMSVRHRLAERRSRDRLPDPSSPYIAHLRLDEGNGAEDYLLGHSSFFDAAREICIVDWRIAPIARIFYRYREGDRFEETFPGRVAEGVVVARRIVVIENGTLARIVGDDLLLDRDRHGRWRGSDRGTLALETGGAETAARPGILGVGIGAAERTKAADITAFLDRDQYAAVAAPPERPLLVLGGAGSGKTTVALHRLSRISAADPASYALSEATVVVPEEGLARLCRRLLEPLGVGPAHVKTTQTWSTELTRRVFGRSTRLSAEAPPLVSSLKRHPALYRALGERLERARPAAKLPRLRRHLAEALTDRGFLAGVVAASGGDLPLTAVEETIRHTMLQLSESVERQLASIVDHEMKQAVDGRPIEEGTPDELAGTLDLEDLPILLFLRARHEAIDSGSISLLVLDEAEDLSLFELSVLGRLLRERGSVTLAGDEAQQTASSFAGWQTSLATLGASDAVKIRLPTSYRCPRPVAELAWRLLGGLASSSPVHPAREGAPVGRFTLPSESQAHLLLIGALRDLIDREPRASVGVVASDADAARRFHALVAELPEARLVLHGEFSFEPGIDVTDVDNAKGLEFDYVVIPDATASVYPSTDEARRRLHVAVTRAAYQLWIVAGGAPSPLLAGE
jgi:ATP-dependent DNA helicase UvrD/PcrA